MKRTCGRCKDDHAAAIVQKLPTMVVCGPAPTNRVGGHSAATAGSGALIVSTKRRGRAFEGDAGGSARPRANVCGVAEVLPNRDAWMTLCRRAMSRHRPY